MRKTKKIWAFLLCALLVIGSLGMPVSAAPAAKTPSISSVQGEMIVSVQNGSSNSGYSAMAQTTTSLNQAIEDSGFTVTKSLHESVSKASGRMNVSSVDLAVKNMGHVYLVKYSNNYTSFEQAAKALRADLQKQGLNVKYIEPNHVYKALGISAAMHSNQEWHYNMIKAPEAWTVTQGSSAVKVAVLDTGIDNNHVNLKNFVNMSLAKNFTDSGSASDTTDRQGHGTHCAGTIASYGVVSGVMKNATLVPVKVLGDNGSGTLYGIVEGILYASEIGSDVISMSLGGGGYDQSMADACKTASQRGTVVVAATGNDGQAQVSYPGQYPYVIGVGSVTNTRARSSFSNYGTGLDVMAPGSDIYSTAPGNRYETMSGTSMATPHVAGVCGLIKSVNKGLTPAQVEDILKRTCQAAGSSYEYGSGIVNAFEAVKAAGGNVTPIEKSTVTTLSTNKSSYTPGETVTATVVVKDEKGAVLSGAAVKLTMTAANGTTTVKNGSTNTSGTVAITFPTTTSMATGNYNLKADVTLANYKASTANATFTLGSQSGTVTIVGPAYSDLKTWTTNYYGWTLYNSSAVIYVELSDGTYHKHGTISANSWDGYPNLQKQISGTATAKNGQKIKYNLNVFIDITQ